MVIGAPSRPRRAVLAAATFAAALVLGGCGGEGEAGDREGGAAGAGAVGGDLSEVEDVEVGVAQHVPGGVTYEDVPPAGGDHDPDWQTCGVYDEPVADANAVHSLEHGAVWITYDPQLAEDEVAALVERAEGQSHVLVSPYDGLPAPIVLVAWGKRLEVEAAADPDIDAFLDAFQQGPQTPEPGAPCAGGVGDPD